MKNLLLLLFLLFFSWNNISSQVTPDSIKSFPGIPILTYLSDEMKYIRTEDFYKKLDSAGIYATEVADMQLSYKYLFENTKLKLLPEQVDPTLNRGINKYSSAYYSVWEAEGTNPAVGDATLYYKNTVGEIINGTVSTLSGQGIVNDTLIYGPYYMQEIRQGDAWINYGADFRLKKENISSPPPLPNSIVCILQVTTSHAIDSPPTYPIDSTYVIKADTITYSMLADTFKTFFLNYTYRDVPRYYTNKPTDTSFYFRTFANYIQYKVLWKGNSNYIRLYVDNIVVTDLIGRDFIDRPNHVITEVNTQMNDNWDGKVAGWVGTDEPICIDQYKPMSIVQDIIDANPNGKSVWYAYGNSWNGRWGDYRNPHGSYKLSQFEELYKKLNKINLWSDMYLYTYPDDDYCSYSPYGDWRDGKIRVMVDSIWGKFQNKDNVFWGASVMGGLYGDPISWLGTREINSRDLLYSINIALLSGAKEISIWKYFANIDIGKPLYRTGLVNVYWSVPDHSTPPYDIDYTDKWHTLKDTIAPRLNGLMGKTLKKLKAYSHKLSIDGLFNQTVNHEYISYIASSSNLENDTCIVDLGIFQDPQNLSVKYFMPLNRYYSTIGNLTFGLRNLSGYNNWKVTDYVDSSLIYLSAINGIAQFSDSIYAGDANLYSIKPVVNYGGNIQSNDTISGTQALNQDGDPLFIKSGATLRVNGTYNIYKDITIEAGGALHITGTGSLNFYNDAKLHVYGNFTNGGNSSNRRVVDFHNTEGGIVLYKAQTLANLSVRNSTNIGIELNSAIDTNETTIIKESEFINCITGVYGTAVKKIIVQWNSFSGCSEGASFNYSSKLYIFNNSFSYCGSGIYLTSTIDNEVRHNQISNCGFGIHLGYSTINAGNNRIYNSELNGIYVGTGSLLNMKGILRMLPCINSLIFTRERGYNTIYNNVSTDGIFTPPAEGEGAEIFLYNAILLADSGSNQIYDNRFGSTTYPVTNLIDGYFDGEQETFSLTHNEWGDTSVIPLQNRFGHLQVIYDPIGVLPEPQNAEGCILINVVHSSNGPIVVDTTDATQGGEGPAYLSYLENLYSVEKDYRNNRDYISSESTLKTIISMFLNIDECSQALSLLYSNYEERGASAEEFMALGDYYISLLLDCTNGQNYESIRHYADLCLMGGRQYQQAMASFQSIIDQYQGTERADFALIDLYTAAYLDSTQQLGKSLIKVTSETLNNKRRELLLKKLGKWEGKSPKQMPTEYMLSQNYPNPFNPSTNIRYAIKDRAEVKLVVYDILGRVIKELVNEVKDPGYYDVQFNMTNFASGVYFYSLQTKHFVKTNKMLLIK